MNFDKVRINLSFEMEGVSPEYLEKVKEFINFDGDIDNKKFIDFFAIDKRPLVLAKTESKPNGQTFGIDDVYTHFLTEIDIVG